MFPGGLLDFSKDLEQNLKKLQAQAPNSLVATVARANSVPGAIPQDEPAISKEEEELRRLEKQGAQAAMRSLKSFGGRF